MSSMVATQYGTVTAVCEPSVEELHEAAELAPRNPFYSAGYAAARQALGAQPWLLGLQVEGHWVTVAPAFMTSGRLNRSLELPSWPRLDTLAPFWSGLLEFCRAQGVSHLELSSFGAEPGPFPGAEPVVAGDSPAVPRMRGGVLVGRRRLEYVLDLRGGDPMGRCSSNHARNIKRARKAGVRLERRTDREACHEHVCLMLASLSRRQERGEQVSVLKMAEEERLRPVAAFVSHGAGELFVAMQDSRILGSILVLRAARGAYYQSAGTSPEGMACGASHFLVHQIALQLQAEGVEQFNLGGADPASGGLERFKSGFGAVPVQLHAAEVLLAGPLRRTLTTLARSWERLNHRLSLVGPSPRQERLGSP